MSEVATDANPFLIRLVGGPCSASVAVPVGDMLMNEVDDRADPRCARRGSTEQTLGLRRQAVGVAVATA